MSDQTEKLFKWGFHTVCMVLFAVCGYFGKGMYETQIEQQRLINQLEVRVAIREANAFTSQEANKLLLSVNTLTNQVAENSKHVTTVETRLLRFEQSFDKLNKKLEEAVPADVLRELRDFRQEYSQKQTD